jgi:hypothetical protein
MASCGPMPRRSKKVLEAKEKKAQEQFLILLCMTPSTLAEEDLRQAEQEIARIESMSDEELRAYYQSPEGLAEIVEYRELKRELDELEAMPIDQRPSLLGRKLIRSATLELYREIHSRVVRGEKRKKIAYELGISINTLKMALRALRRHTGNDYETHLKTHRHRTWEEKTKCPQCRGHIYEGHNTYGEDKRRVQREKREIPFSHNKQSKNDPDYADKLHYRHVRQPGNRSTSAHGVGRIDESEDES